MNRPPAPVRRHEKITASGENEAREYSRANRLSCGPGDRAIVNRFGTYLQRTAAPAASSVVIRTGASGIPGRSGATPGKAEDVVAQNWTADDDLEPGDTITVFNISSEPVAPNRYGKADDVDGRWVVDVESCA